MADNITYTGNKKVKMIFVVHIDVSNIDTDASYIWMKKSDGVKVKLSIDDTDSDNQAIIHYSTEEDFNIEGTYIVQPYIVLKDDGGDFLCEEDVFYVREGI